MLHDYYLVGETNSTEFILCVVCLIHNLYIKTYRQVVGQTIESTLLEELKHECINFYDIMENRA